MNVGAALMSDTLHALGWLLVMDYTRVVALWWCRWVGADGNNVRPASLWKGCRSGHMGATYPHLGRWATLPHQMNYGAKEELIVRHQRPFYILWEFCSFSENCLWSRKRPWPAIITPWNQKLFLREIWQQFFSFSLNYFRRLCSIQTETQ